MGSDSDNDMFRKQLNDKMTKTQSLMKKLQVDLEEYKNMQIVYEKEVSITKQRITYFFTKLERAQTKVSSPKSRFPNMGR